jgi:hypothetical protein
MTAGTLRRLLALALALGLVAPLAAAPPTGELSGRVLGEDGLTPRANVVVRLQDAGAARDYPSAPTRRDGAFTVSGAPAGRYDVIVEADGGAFVADGAIDLAAGRNSPVALTLRRGSMNAQTTGEGTGLGTRPLSPTVKWIILGSIVVASAFVINEVTEDEDEEPLASGF